MSNESEHTEIKVELAEIGTKLDIVIEQHEKRIDKLESVQGKQNLIAATMSAVGIGIAMLVKYVVTGGKA